MSNPFDGLEPSYVWKNFAALTQIPRPSKHEERAVQFMQEWAARHGFETTMDTAISDTLGNLVIRVPATPGKEEIAPTVLQGHLDMVPVKAEGIEFDFLTQPIPVVRDGDWLKAEGTTLGADNGIGVAMGMALAEDPEASHGPLELLLTVDEETGMSGAFGLDPHLLSGKRMINIDSEEEGAVFAGCAGGADNETVFPLTLVPAAGGWEAATISLGGLAGGHSGLAIHENRANALRLLAMVLGAVKGRQEFGLTHFAGGDMRNSIPKTASATVTGPAGLRGNVDRVIGECLPLFKQEFGAKETGMEFAVENTAPTQCLSFADSIRFVDLLLALPHGLDTIMPPEPFGLVVETSTNLATVEWTQTKATIANLTRSSVAFAIERVRDQIRAVARLAGAEAIDGGGYPGWQPKLDSGLLATARSAYRATGGEEARVTAIHAGLECGIIGQAYPEMEMISIGPNMHDVHSPDERLSISSTNRFYSYLRTLISTLA